MKYKIFYCCFFVGFFLLTVATVGVIITSWDLIKVDAFRMGIYGAFAVFFFYLLIDTLFFALPFKNTYIDKEELPRICQSGVYALCRHPGVLWFMGFYIFLGLALMIPLLLTAAVVFNILNILYVLFQDRWTFMKSFENYDKYKENTPFLLPNSKSIKNCLKTL
jgi:protein-S-isoprenylcysteine O-methyltransferase Ste14